MKCTSARLAQSDGRAHRAGDRPPPVHDQAMDRILVMDGGRIIEQGKPSRVAGCQRCLRIVVGPSLVDSWPVSDCCVADAKPVCGEAKVVPHTGFPEPQGRPA